MLGDIANSESQNLVPVLEVAGEKSTGDLVLCLCPAASRRRRRSIREFDLGVRPTAPPSLVP